MRISLANVELLTIRIRLLVCSIDKAEQIGLNWWRYDRSLVAQDDTEATIARLEQRIAELERQLACALELGPPRSTPPPPIPTYERGEPSPCLPLNEPQAAPVSSMSSTASWTKASSSTHGSACPWSAST